MSGALLDPRPHRILLIARNGLAGAVFAVAAATGTGAISADLAPVPPERRTVESPDGVFGATAIWTGTDGDFSARLRITDRRTGSVAEVALEYPIGPRSLMVSDAGITVTLDEWTRRQTTSHAVEVFAPDGSRIAQYSRREVLRAAGVEDSGEKSAATGGTWLASPPRWTRADTLAFGVADTCLRLSIGPDGTALRPAR